MSAASGSPVTSSSRRALDHSLVSGVAWTAAARLGTQVVTSVSLLVLARLLTPRDFGLMGMAAVLSAAITMLSEFGIDGAVLVSKDLTPAKISHLHALAILLGFGGTLIACAAAPVAAVLFRTPQLLRIVPAVGIGFCISGFRVVPQSVLLRTSRFKLVAGVESGQAIASTATAVALAYLGFSYWSLVLGSLVGTLFTTLTLSLMYPCRPGKPVWGDLRQEITFSWQLLVGRLGWYVYSNSDFAVAGRTLGGSILGLYTMAWNIASLPVEKVSGLVTRVTPSVLLQVRDHPAELRRYIRGVTETLALVTFPIAFGLSVVSRPLVQALFDHRWWPVAGPLCLLAACASVRCIVSLMPQVLNVLGDTAAPMWNTLAIALVLPASFWYASRWGAVGIAATWLCVYPLLTIPLLFRMLFKTGMSAGEYFSTLLPASVGCVVMATVVLLEQHWMGTGLAAWLRLAVEVMTGAVCYCGIILLFFRSRAELLLRTVLRRKAALAI